MLTRSIFFKICQIDCSITNQIIVYKNVTINDHFNLIFFNNNYFILFKTPTCSQDKNHFNLIMNKLFLYYFDFFCINNIILLLRNCLAFIIDYSF